jgi:hypothetical protein
MGEVPYQKSQSPSQTIPTGDFLAPGKASHSSYKKHSKTTGKKTKKKEQTHPHLNQKNKLIYPLPNTHLF